MTLPGWGKSTSLAFLLISLLLFPLPSWAQTSLPRYDLQARLKASDGKITGKVRIRQKIPPQMKIRSLPVVVYPQIYRHPSPRLNDINFHWIYPRTFSPGTMTIEKVQVQGQTIPLSRLRTKTHTRRDGRLLTWKVIPLKKPLTSEIDCTLSFEVNFPHKYDTFGAYRQGLLAQGGWYPRLPPLHGDRRWEYFAPPAKSRFSVELSTSKYIEILLNGNYHSFTRGTWRKELTAPALTLSARPNYFVHRFKVEKNQLDYYQMDNNPSKARELEEIFGKVCAYYRKRFGTSLGKVVLVEAPLRTELTAHGAGMSLISDHFMEVTPLLLPDFHRIQAAEEILFNALYSKVQKKEKSRHSLWTTEAASWGVLGDFATDHFGGNKTVLSILDFFSFIPTVNALIKDPRFPFAQAFFGNFYRRDEFHDDFLTYNYSHLSGRVVWEKALDLSSYSQMKTILESYLKGSQSFLTILRDKIPKTAQIIVRDWLFQPLPRWNYGLEKIEKTGREKGEYRYQLVISRTPYSQRREAVTVLVEDERGNQRELEVLVDSSRKKVFFSLNAELDRVVIDPKRRLNEKVRVDNTNIFQWKILIDQFSANVDLNREEIEFNVGARLIFEENYRHQYIFKAFEGQESRGGIFSYRFQFGKPLSPLSLTHSVSLGVSIERLKLDFVLPESGEVNEEGLVNSLLLEYGFDTRLSDNKATDGTTLSLGVEYSDKVLAGDFRFIGLDSRLSQIFSINHNHIFGVKLGLGYIHGNPPPQRLFSLGGEKVLRGVKEGERLGSYRWMAIFEYRPLLVTDLSTNFFYISWLRRLQGAIFVGLGSTAGDWKALWNTEALVSEIGVGLRLHLQGFGFRESLFRFDIARRIDQFRKSEFLFYIGVDQSF